MSAQAAYHSHHSILALGIENFGTRSSAARDSLRRAMYDVFAGARERTGLLPDEDIVVEDHGDGFVVLFPATVSTVLLAGSFVRALDDGLSERAPLFDTAHTLRFRVALHHGMAKRDARGWSGEAINTTCRLVDAPPLRVALAAATKAHLVFVVSDEIYQGVIRHGCHGIDAGAYLPVDFEAKRGTRLRGWVTAPGYPVPPGVLAPAPADEAAPADAATPGTIKPDSTTPGSTKPGSGMPGSAKPAATNKTTHDPDTRPDTQPSRRRNPDRPAVTFKARTVNGDVVAGDKHVYGRIHPKDRP
ncbi:hypothetical protein [Streptomyces sp. SID3343]|uniref:hypothetical protein n=1 Tax=Streptomyces sp. SID3343 TaxID=2690260 RepID=UPI00136A9303|nr:hypothetical protein [Streptomyces sp. SID3343]MYW01069.1 hypothetical protein [Streptomyces sp. SID3343]